MLPANPSNRSALHAVFAALTWPYPLVVAALAAALQPVVIALQPRPDLAWAAWAVGGVILTAGLFLKKALLKWIGALLLWGATIADLATQVAPFATPFAAVWGLRGLWLMLGLLLWALIARPTLWLLRAVGAVGAVTLAGLVAMIYTSPPVERTAIFDWLALDSQGTLYAAEADRGVIWVLDSNGNRSQLWPRRAVVGQPGPGFQPAGFGVELSSQAILPALGASRLPDTNFLFCGLAVDTQDRLYVVDPDVPEVRQFTRDGLLRTAWPLPNSYDPSLGCAAADDQRVYIADQAVIYVFNQDGQKLAEWKQAQPPNGLAVGLPNRLLVLYEQSIAALQVPDGRQVEEWPLPAHSGGPATPYRAIAARANGEVLLADLNRNVVRRFGADHRELTPLGKEGEWPGQFAGPGGWPGEFAVLGLRALAVDRGQNVFVSDGEYRTIQRFRPDGQVDFVIAVPELESGEVP